MTNKTIAKVMLWFALVCLFLSIYLFIPLFIIYSFCCVAMAFSIYMHEKGKS